MSNDIRTTRKIKKQVQTQYVFELNTILDEQISDEEKQGKILMLNIGFIKSENPNDYDKNAIKNFVYHLDLDKLLNPTFEGYPELVLKIYNNYKKQEQEKHQEQIKINETAFNVVC